MPLNDDKNLIILHDPELKGDQQRNMILVSNQPLGAILKQYSLFYTTYKIGLLFSLKFRSENEMREIFESCLAVTYRKGIDNIDSYCRNGISPEEIWEKCSTVIVDWHYTKIKNIDEALQNSSDYIIESRSKIVPQIRKIKKQMTIYGLMQSHCERCECPPMKPFKYDPKAL